MVHISPTDAATGFLLGTVPNQVKAILRGRTSQPSESSIPVITVRPDVHSYVLSRSRRSAALLGANNTVIVIDLTGDRTQATIGLPVPIRHLVVSDDGKWIAAALNDHRVVIVDVNEGKTWPHPNSPHAPATRLRFAHGANTLVWGRADGSVALWPIPVTGLPIEISTNGDAPVSSVDAHAGANRVVTGDRSGNVWLGELQTGRTIKPALEHEGAVVSAALSASGRWLVTATDSDSVSLRDAGDGREVGTIEDLTEIHRLRHAHLSPDEWSVVLSTTPDGSGPVGHVEVGHLLVPDRALRALEKLTRIALIDAGALEESHNAKDTSLDYFRTPPAKGDATYWTALLHLLTQCNGAQVCADPSDLAGWHY
jgi:WD40 repeat protein